MDTTIVRTGEGHRGCRPEEYNLYEPRVVYLSCQACDFFWEVSLGEFELKKPDKCPLCDELWIYGHYVLHNLQWYEHRVVPKLSERRIDVLEVTDIPIEDAPFGKEVGLFKLHIYPADDPKASKPEFIKIAQLYDSTSLANNPFWENDVLRVLIDDSRSWKRAFLFNWRVINAIGDL